MKLTDRLRVEHGVFLIQLRHLEALVQQGAPREALAAVTGAIVGAEAHHSAVEDRVLYPALRKRLGEELPALDQIEADHATIRKLGERIGSGSFDDETVTSLISLLRAHMEREIHDTFARIEELIPEDELSAMFNWNVEHVFEASGHRELWLDGLGKE